MELKKQKINNNQETDGYETDKRHRTEKLKRKEITLTEKLEKQLKQKKAVMQSGYPWNQSEEVPDVYEGRISETGKFEFGMEEWRGVDLYR